MVFAELPLDVAAGNLAPLSIHEVET